MPERHGNHSPACVELYVASKQLRKAWRALWPDACVECRGTGTATHAPLALPAEQPECPACLANSVGPRCDEEDVIAGGPRPQCTHCGWAPGEPNAAEPPLAHCLGAPQCRPEVPHA